MYVTCHCNTTELLFRVSHFMWELVRWIQPPYTWMSRLNIFLTRVKEDYKLVLNRRSQQNTLKTWQTIDSASFVCGKQNNFYFWFIVLVALSKRDDVCMGYLFLDIFLEFDEEDQISLLTSATSKDFVNWSLWYREMRERKLATQ